MRVLTTFLLCVSLLFAAPPKPQQARIRIPAWSDSSEPLTADSLVATAGGKEAGILDLRGPQDDLLLLLVLDVVGDLNEIDLARQALITAIAELPANVYVGLMRAQDGLRVLQDPTDDHEVIIKFIEELTISGTPGLLETVETASKVADSILAKAPVRIAVLFITDSDIRDYREDFTNPVINWSDSRDLSRRFPEGLVRERISKLANNLGSSQTPIFVVHLEHYADRLNEAYQSGLLQLATTTGGAAVVCRSSAEIGAAIGDTLRRITNHYGIDLEVSGNGGDNVDISLEAPGGGLSYRQRIHLKKKEP